MDDFGDFVEALLKVRPEALSRTTSQLELESDGKSVTIPLDRLAEYLALYTETYVIGALSLYDEWRKDRQNEDRE